MEINANNLRTLGIGFNAAYSQGLGQAPTDHLRIADEITSTKDEEEYGWLNEMPDVREWIGDRVINNLATSSYRVRNKDWELTHGVSRNRIMDDNIGIYSKQFEKMGRSTGALPCRLVFELLVRGFTTPCYDGQYFFDTDHPVLDEHGVIQSVANTDGGSGEPWFLLDISQSVKPIILQWRKRFEFVAKDKPTDDNVFNNKTFLYGSDARANVGYGLWQTAWGSKQPLNESTYENARAGLSEMTGDYGRPLGLDGQLLLVTPRNEPAARKLLIADKNDAGASNIWVGSAELMKSAWLKSALRAAA